MGSDFDFKGVGGEGGGGANTPQVDFQLPRQFSIYSMTFDEFQSSVGGIGKDFGSMNMDELLKNIWSAEENGFGSTSTAAGKDGAAPGYLQRQGSLTLPRTLSQKTVDEVWRDISKEFGPGKEENIAVSGMNFTQTQRQVTLGEVTLEEFLVRAGVVREEVQGAPPPKPSAIGFLGNFSTPMSSSSGYVYQHQQGGLMGGLVPESGNSPSLQSANLVVDSKGARHQLSPQNPQPLLPKQTALAYGSTVRLANSNHHLASTGTRNGILGIPEQTVNKPVLQNYGLPSAGLGMIGAGSPVISPSNGEPSSSVSPVPYFNGSLSGRKTPALEKVVERRQRRMIKNRESAARSRARKQAYTVELEGEVAKLKEENENLRKKQAELVEMHRNQVLELMSQQESKRKCLRRTGSGPL